MWKTIDDTTEETRFIVEIYKNGNKLFGKIKKILNEEERNNLCTECEGVNCNKQIEGMGVYDKFPIMLHFGIIV
ncbi:DUF2147 domain-containing protein [Aquimarina sp. I32.4]|uniref:DUF2147 domain-containing protein n=1 Tax=Aquimarina sp. I32.4 TaxID=2053903 RepID=UPI000CDEBA18|nr:DUF2147 domain-containing protein [Aquimarina sp. I32.4]